LNHIRSPNRFELVLADNNIIGTRQAALQVGGKAWEGLEAKGAADPAAVDAAIKTAIAGLVK